MTARFEAEFLTRGRDWSKDEYSEGAIAFTYEQIAPDVRVALQRLNSGQYKVPREIRFEAIPKTSTGKIQKFQLRERAKSSSAIE